MQVTARPSERWGRELLEHHWERSPVPEDGEKGVPFPGWMLLLEQGIMTQFSGECDRVPGSDMSSGTDIRYKFSHESGQLKYNADKVIETGHI